MKKAMRAAICSLIVVLLCGITASCGAKGDKAPHEHRYKLNADESKYVCELCDDWYPSGKGTVSNDGSGPFAPGEGVSNMEQNGKERHRYIFVGSSITYGHTGGYTMADMLNEDCIRADYDVFDGEMRSVRQAYLRKTDSVTPNDDGVAGVYVCDYEKVTLYGNGKGKIGDNEFTYVITGNDIVLSRPEGNVFAFTASFIQGDVSYKHAYNGAALSGLKDKYTATGEKISYAHKTYVELADEAIAEHGREKADVFFLQLSTNDVGQYVDPTHTQHIPFGKVTENSVRSSEAFDRNTSYGAMEYIIAKAKETWQCEVVMFIAGQGTGNTTAGYQEMRNAVIDEIVPKWQIDVLDFWGDDAVTNGMQSNTGRYLFDTVHPTLKGYEAFYFPRFRAYLDGKGGAA